VTLDIILGIEEEDILISWFVIILALLGVVLLFVCCMIHCKLVSICVSHVLIHSITYLLTYLPDC